MSKPPGGRKVVKTHTINNGMCDCLIAQCDDGTLWSYAFWKHSDQGPWEPFDGPPEPGVSTE